jgi:hypothetical protein
MMPMPTPRWRDLFRRAPVPAVIVTTATPGYGWQVGDVITFNDGPALRVARVVSGTTLELEPASWWRRLLRRVSRLMWGCLAAITWAAVLALSSCAPVAAQEIPHWVLRGIAMVETNTTWRDIGDLDLSPGYGLGAAGEVGPWQLHPDVLTDLGVADQAARIHDSPVYAESLTRAWLLHLFGRCRNWRTTCAAYHVGLAGMSDKKTRARGLRYADRVHGSGTLY